MPPEPSPLTAGDIMLPPPERPEQRLQRAAEPFVRPSLEAIRQALLGPGQAMRQKQPRAGAMWSDEDEAIRQANAAAESGWAAQTAMGLVGTPALTGGVPAGALGSGARAMFDYSRLHEIPNVPQFALPRVQPARGTPKQFLELGENKERIAAANELVGKGTKQGGLEWYNTQQMADAWRGELGQQQGQTDFKLFIDLVSATSPEMKVPQNIRAASYYYWLMKNNKELPPLIKSEKGNWKVPEGAIPAGYGARTQALHVQNVRNIAESGGLPVLQNPKPPSFATNLTGNYQPVTIDRHNMRLFGMPGDTPGLGYDFMERLQQDEARKMGIAPAQYQASGWIGGAEQTGMLSGNQPFLRLFEDQINRTAEYFGQTPQQTMQQLVRGQLYLR